MIALEGIDEKRKQVYYIASPGNPTQRYLYRTPLHGGPAVRVTPENQPGTHSYQFSTDMSHAIHTWSSANRPAVRDLVSLPDHRRVRALTGNDELRKAWEELDRKPVEFFRVPVEDGVELDGWLVSPPRVEEGKKYPLLVFVYGEPAGQTVLDRWGGRRQLWHLMHAQNGYFVMSVDNRGTPAPRGRHWRKVVYRKVGVLAPRDQAAALDAVLARRPEIDPERVGVWGWSGGGSMTLNMMFKYPGKYAVGMSVAPVPNQRLYDTIYQERYMGLPKDNVEGFRDGSPIHFAAGLEGGPAPGSRDRRRQRPLPGDRGARRRAGGPEEALHHDGLSEPEPRHPGRGQHHPPSLPAAHQLPLPAPAGRGALRPLP